MVMAESRAPGHSGERTPGDRTLLIVEDDKSFLQRLARAMESRGFTVTTAESIAARYSFTGSLSDVSLLMTILLQTKLSSRAICLRCSSMCDLPEPRPP